MDWIGLGARLCTFIRQAIKLGGHFSVLIIVAGEYVFKKGKLDQKEFKSNKQTDNKIKKEHVEHLSVYPILMDVTSHMV